MQQAHMCHVDNVRCMQSCISLYIFKLPKQKLLIYNNRATNERQFRSVHSVKEISFHTNRVVLVAKKYHKCKKNPSSSKVSDVSC